MARRKIIEQKSRTLWCRLTQEEQMEIIEKSNIKKEDAQRKKNKIIADIMLGKQRTIDNSWE